jgi:hypothetical protein
MNTMEPELKRRHVHVVLFPEEFSKLQDIVKSRRERVGPFVRRLVLDVLEGDGRGKTEPRPHACGR